MTDATLDKTMNQRLANQYDDDETSETEVLEPRRRRSKPTQYPTSKPGHYSKDRRHVPITKKSDAKKSGARSGTAKGKKGKKANSTP